MEAIKNYSSLEKEGGRVAQEPRMSTVDGARDSFLSRLEVAEVRDELKATNGTNRGTSTSDEGQKPGKGQIKKKAKATSRDEVEAKSKEAKKPAKPVKKGGDKKGAIAKLK